MIVLLTEFTDATSAEFLVQSAARLMRTHLLLVVVLRDDDLDALAERVPDDIDDVTRAVTAAALLRERLRSEEHTSELPSLMRISYAVFCLKKKKHTQHTTPEYKTATLTML